jgi:hypothetical protein
MRNLFINIDIENFEQELNNKYLKSLTHEKALEILGLEPGTPIKKNGTWPRNLIILNITKLELHRIKIQKFQWIDKDSKKHYASIFPSFIFKHNPLHSDLIEYIANNLNDSGNVFEYVEDPDDILESEDKIIKNCLSLEKKLSKSHIPEKIAIKYTEQFNDIANVRNIKFYKFHILKYIIKLTSVIYNKTKNILSFLNSIINK